MPSSRTKDTIEVASAIIGIFVFLTGVQSLPSLLGKSGPPESSVFRLGIPVGIKVSLFVLTLALLYFGVFLVCRLIYQRWIAPRLIEDGAEGTLILVISFLFMVGALVLIVESFFGPLEGLFISFLPSFLTIAGIFAGACVGMISVFVGFRVP